MESNHLFWATQSTKSTWLFWGPIHRSVFGGVEPGQSGAGAEKSGCVRNSGPIVVIRSVLYVE